MFVWMGWVNAEETALDGATVHIILHKFCIGLSLTCTEDKESSAQDKACTQDTRKEAERSKG